MITGTIEPLPLDAAAMALLLGQRAARLLDQLDEAHRENARLAGRLAEAEAWSADAMERVRELERENRTLRFVCRCKLLNRTWPATLAGLAAGVGTVVALRMAGL